MVLVPTTDDDEPRDLALEHLLELAHRHFVDGLRTSLPGKIVSYDADKQSASVQVQVQHGEVIAGDRVAAPLPILNDVIVVFLGGGSRARRTWPVKAGDTCWVMWASSSIAAWRVQGGTTPIDPADDRRHHIADAVCIVGAHSFADVPTDAPTDAVVEHLDDGVVMKIGSSSASKAPAWNDDLSALAGVLSGVSPGPGSGDSLVAALSAFFLANPGFPVGPQKIKIE